MPCKTIPTESPTKIISQYLSNILATGAVYAVKQIKGFLNFLNLILLILNFFFMNFIPTQL